MMRTSLVAPFAVLLAFLSACSSAPKKSKVLYAHPTSANCARFTDTIRSCAETAHHADLGIALAHVARCETGNKCVGRIDSPTGLYHGPFQFLRQTWDAQCRPIFKRRHAGSCLSKGAIYDTCCATVCAAEIVAHGGIHNWPVCGKKARLPASVTSGK